MKNKPGVIYGLIIFFVFLSAFVPLIISHTAPGLPPSQDTIVHVGNSVEAGLLLKNGEFPLNWLPDIARGYGGPNFLYYGYYFFLLPAWLTNYFGIDIIQSIKLSLIIVRILGIIASFLFFKKAGGWQSGLLGTVLYQWSPYINSLVFRTGAFPEFAATQVYPMVFYCILKADNGYSSYWLSLAALCYATISGIHTLSFVILFPFVALILFAANSFAVKAFLNKYCIYIGLSVLIMCSSLYYPVLGLKKVSIYNQFVEGSTYNFFEESYLPIGQILLKDPTLINLTTYIYPGRLHILLIAASVVVLLLSYKNSSSKVNNVSVCMAICAIAGLLLTTKLAGITKSIFDVIKYIQFPWRFLSMFSLFTAASVPLALNAIGLRPGVVRMFILAIMSFVPIYYARKLPTSEINYTNVETASRHGIKKSGSTLDHENKYMPASAIRAAKQAGKLISASFESTAIDAINIVPNKYHFKILVNGDFDKITFGQYFFEGWSVEDNGIAIDYGIENQTGLISVILSKGEHDLCISYRGSVIYRALLWITFVAICVIGLCNIICCIRFIKNRLRSKSKLL